MRIGIVAHWFNRGQGVVARDLRSALDELGHDTSVLARPTRPTNRRPTSVGLPRRREQPGPTRQPTRRQPLVERHDVGDRPGVPEATDFAIPASEYGRWATGRRL